MKILSLLGIFCLLSFAAKSQEITKQEKGYFNLTEIGYFAGKRTIETSNYGSGSYNTHTFSLRNINGWFVTNQISVGLGVGADGYNANGGSGYNNTFLIFLDGRYYFKNEANTFFVYGDIGRSVAIDDNIEKGTMVNAGAGYKFKIAKRTAMTASVGYVSQGIDKEQGITKNQFNSAAFKIGFLF